MSKGTDNKNNILTLLSSSCSKRSNTQRVVSHWQSLLRHSSPHPSLPNLSMYLDMSSLVFQLFCRLLEPILNLVWLPGVTECDQQIILSFSGVVFFVKSTSIGLLIRVALYFIRMHYIKKHMSARVQMLDALVIPGGWCPDTCVETNALLTL